MRLIKTCLSCFLVLLIFIITTVTLTVNTFTSIALSPKIPHEIIDDLDFKEVIQKAAKKLADDIRENPENPDEQEEGTKSAQEDSMTPEEIEKTADDIVNSIAPGEEEQIKTTMKEFITELTKFLADPDKNEIRINIQESKRILFKITLRSPQFTDHLNLPLPICTQEQTENSSTKNCITEDSLVTLIDKSLTGKLTQADIVEVMPLCTNVTEKTKGQCITQEEIDKLLESNIDQNKNEEDEDQLGKIFQNDELVISEKDVSDNFPVIRKYISRIDLFILGALLLSILLSSLVLLLKKAGGLYYLAAAFLLSSMIFFTAAGTINTQDNKIIDKLTEQSDVTENPLYENLLEIYYKYTDSLFKALLLRGALLLIIAVILISIAYLLKKRKNAKKIDKKTQSL
jgi:hypothetical protein